jgi:thiol-disulfide isomerase/thioredoxin
MERWHALAAVAVVALAGSSAMAQSPAHTRGWLGIAMDATADGVRVAHVIRGSPADRAGVHDGDRLLRVLGNGVATPGEVAQALATHSAGDLATLSLRREGHEISISVTLGPFPSPDEMLRMDHLGAPAPTWAGIEPASGAPPSVESLRGRVVVVDFWASWCGPCREIIPELNVLQDRYGAQGLSVVGITTDPPDTAAAFKERVGMRYSVEVDRHADTSRAYGVSALPTLFVLDRRGVVRELSVGFDPSHGPQLEAVVKELLREPQAPAR